MSKTHHCWYGLMVLRDNMTQITFLDYLNANSFSKYSGLILIGGFEIFLILQTLFLVISMTSIRNSWLVNSFFQSLELLVLCSYRLYTQDYFLRFWIYRELLIESGEKLWFSNFSLLIFIFSSLILSIISFLVILIQLLKSSTLIILNFL